MNDVATHLNHNALDFSSVNINNGTLCYFNCYSTDIVAAKSGKVVISKSDTDSLGSHIVIQQDDGNYTVYGHLASRVKQVDDIVKIGEKIGVQGDTGATLNPSTGVRLSHLHFESFSSQIINHPNCQNANFNANNCYNSGFTDSTYKIIPQFDECFVSRGGSTLDESNCKENSNNVGYPTKDQSGYYGIYWTSINSPSPPITDPNITNVISQHRMLGGKLSMKVVKRMKAAKSTFGIDKVVIVKR